MTDKMTYPPLNSIDDMAAFEADVRNEVMQDQYKDAVWDRVYAWVWGVDTGLSFDLPLRDLWSGIARRIDLFAARPELIAVFAPIICKHWRHGDELKRLVDAWLGDQKLVETEKEK